MWTITHKFLFFVVLFFTIWVVWKWYWRVQITYNSSVLSLYTPDSFPIATALKERYDNLVKLGIDHLKNKRVVVTSLVRDVARKLPDIKRKVERMCQLFGDYRILIVENDSTDGTRAALLHWAAENPRVVILGCGYNASECKLPKAPKTIGHGVDRTRIQKMVDLRNIYLNEIKKSYSDWDYAVMWDMDMIGSVYLDGVTNSFGYLSKNPDVDVVCAYGIYRWGMLTLFYDTYALLHRGETFNIEMKTIHDLRKGLWEAKYNRGDEPVDVDSCFSGFAIYRISGLVDDSVYYDMSPPENLECEHVRLHIKMKGKKVVNPSMINYVLLND